MKRIVVVGPGAIGCLFAGLLSRQAEVWLLDHDPARAERLMAQGGIFCTGIDTWNARVPVTTDTRDIGIADLVIVCTKAFHTSEALANAKAVIGRDTAVLSVQNGIGNVDLIAKSVGPERTFAGATHQAAILISEGRIHHTFDGPTVIGSLLKDPPHHLKKIKMVLAQSGISVKVSHNINGLLWSKLIINVGINAVSALTRLQNGHLLEDDDAKAVMRAAVDEAAAVARRKRIRLLYQDPIKHVFQACKRFELNRSSMLQDVVNKKRTEIDFINGVIVDEAKKYKVAVPVNKTLCRLVKVIEQSYSLQAGVL